METAAPLQATLRTEFGKGPSRRLREEGKIPAVVYVNGQDPIHVAVDNKELVERLTSEYALNARFRLEIDGHDDDPVVMLREYQRDPVRREITHADFLIIDPNRVFETEVPLVLNGKAKGEASGGRLRQIRRELLIRARAGDIPVKLESDISPLRINGVRRVSEIESPEGVEVLYDVDYAVAVVSIPRGIEAVEDEEEEEEEEGMEIEVTLSAEGEEE